MYYIYGLNPLVFLNYVVNKEDIHYTVSSIILKGFIECKMEHNIMRLIDKYKVVDKMIHYGIISKYKKCEEYKKLFFEWREGFYGISNNVFYDSNINERRDRLLMLSIGSWNHNQRKYLETVKGRHTYVLDRLEKKVRKNRMNEMGKSIVMFVQNYSKDEYWFGWDDGNVEKWIERELETIREIRKYSNKNIKIKFHPKTDRKYKDIMKERVKEDNVEYINIPEDLDSLLFDEDVYCCVVNSGSVAMEVCVRGVPLFCRDDSYSGIPVYKFGITDMSKLETFTIEDLPDQKDVLDFICSQCFLIEEINELILCIENNNVVVEERSVS